MTDLRQLHADNIRAEVAQGVVDGLTSILEDDKFVAKFWHRGYEELSQRSAAGASQWFGKRLLTGIIVACTLAGFLWLARQGALK